MPTTMKTRRFLARCLVAGVVAFGVGSAASWLPGRTATATGGGGALAEAVLPKPVHAAQTNTPAPFRFEERIVPVELPVGELLQTRFRIEGMSRFEISVGDSLAFDMDVAQYRDVDNAPRRAIVYLPDDRANSAPLSGPDPYRARLDAWNDLRRQVMKHTDERALFVGWWDNMQRLHLHTGRRGLPRLPDAGGYPLPEQRRLWERVAGGLAQDDSLECLSKRLLEDVDEALATIGDCAWGDESGPVFLLLSTDDLSHIQEIAYLAERAIPLETRIFSSEGDIHGVVASVNTWAGHGDGTGSYLVHPAPGFAVRAWRVTDEAFENSLLVRLLPFSSSLDRGAPRNARLVYQSAAGAYLSIHEVSRAR